MIQSLYVLVLLLLIAFAVKADPIPINPTELGVPISIIEPPLQGNGRKDFRLVCDQSDEDKKLPIQAGQTLYFMATPLAGDIDLYVSTQGEPQVNLGHCTNCINEGVTAHGEIASIDFNSPNFPTGDQFTFYIAVLTHDYTPASFVMNVKVSDEGDDKEGTTTALHDSIPIIGAVHSKKYTYFKYTLTQDSEISTLGEAGNDIVISVTSVGETDPDIYVSTNLGDNPTKRPTSSKYYWKSSDWRSDQLVIPHDDAKFTATEPFYIGVYGFSSVENYFIIQVSTKKNYGIQMDGSPLTYQGTNEIQYYKFLVVKAQEIALNAAPLSFRGDPDVYVTDDVAADKPVSPSNSKWSSSGIGSDSIRIQSPIPNENGKVAWYYIAIRTFRTTKYALTCTSEGTPILLESGKSTIQQVETGSPIFFKYFHVDRYSDINLNAQSFNLNPVNVYVSNPASNNPKPDISVHDEVAYISGSNAHWTKQHADAGTYHFGVYATRPGITNFTISVVTNSTVAILRDGVTIPHNSIAKDGYRYFMFSVGGPLEEDITITAAPYTGSEVDLFVSTAEVETRPTKENCDSDKCWTAESWKSDSILISKDSPLVTEDTRTFYIGVRGRTYDTNYFRIVAFTSSSNIQLQDGQPVDGSVAKGKWIYYTFLCQKNEQITIELDQESPSATMNVDLYGSFDVEKPNIDECRPSDVYCQKSVNIGSNDLISLSVHSAPRPYYIAVYGQASEEDQLIPFKITAREQYHVIDHYHSSIIEQSPAQKLQQIHVTSIYSFAKFAVISNTLISGRTDMYLNANNTGVDESAMDSSLYKSSSWPGNLIVVKNEGNHPDTNVPMSEYFKNHEWSVGVYSKSDSNYIVSAHLSHYFPFDAFALHTRPHLSSVPQGQKLHFQYQVKYDSFEDYGKPAKEDMFLNIRVISGTIELYADFNWRIEPNANNHTYRYTGSAGSIMTLKKEDLKQGSTIYFTVFSPTTDSTFELTLVSQTDPKYISQDQPSWNEGEANIPSFFQILNLASQNDEKETKVKIVAESCDNNPPPRLLMSTSNVYPNTSDFEYESYGSGFQSRIEADIKNHAQIFYLSAVPGGELKSIYSVVATTHEFIRPVITNHDITAELVNIKDDKAHISLRIPPANRPTLFADKKLKYSIYTHEAPTQQNDMNMKTACGVQINLNREGSVLEDESHSSTQPIEYTLVLDAKKIWQFNILVDDGMGMAAVYNGLYYQNGEFYPAYPTVFNRVEVSIGTILILLVLTGFSLYILIGSFVRLVFLKKKGADAIIHKKFWFDLPFLFVDGILFVVTCGRRSTSYDYIDEGNVNADIEGGADTYADSVDVPADDKDGYGGI